MIQTHTYTCVHMKLHTSKYTCMYVGQTGKTVLERCKQHQYNVRTANSSSALFTHKRDKDHFIDWGNAKMIYKATSVTERLIAETVLIKGCNTMNISDGLYKLDNVLKKD